MAGCVGRDRFGREAIAGLQHDGIRTEIAKVAAPTGTALITVAERGVNTIVVASGANMCCDEALVGRALGSAQEPGILLLQNEIPDDANRYALRAARAAGWITVFNPAPARALSPALLPLIDIIVPNETEAVALSGLHDPDAAGRHLLAQGVRAVLTTLGEKGAVYRDSAGGWRCPALPVQAEDTTAAGDAYIGALAVALAEQRAITECLGFAAAAAALAVARLGAQPSLGSREEVATLIARYGMPVPLAC